MLIAGFRSLDLAHDDYHEEEEGDHHEEEDDDHHGEEEEDEGRDDNLYGKG